MQNKRVLAVVLNYNGILFTDNLFFRTIESLKSQTHRNLDVIVADNNSNDGSAEEAGRRFPDVRIVKLRKNFATMGYNAGIKIFLRENYDYLLLCNNDIKFSPDFIASMVDFAEKIPEAGLITPRMMMLDDPDVYNSTGIIINKSGFAWDRNFEDRESISGIPKSCETAAASGGAMFCTREAVKRTGVFDQIYRAYYEDVDFSIRMKRRTGLKIFYNSKAVCLHAFSKSWGNSPKKEFYMLRNRYYFILIHFSSDLLFSAARFLFFNTKHEDPKYNRRIMVSLFFNLPMLILRRIVYSRYGYIRESDLEKSAGFPLLSNQISAKSASEIK